MTTIFWADVRASKGDYSITCRACGKRFYVDDLKTAREKTTAMRCFTTGHEHAGHPARGFEILGFTGGNTATVVLSSDVRPPADGVLRFERVASVFKK